MKLKKIHWENLTPLQKFGVRKQQEGSSCYRRKMREGNQAGPPLRAMLQLRMKRSEGHWTEKKRVSKREQKLPVTSH